MRVPVSDANRPEVRTLMERAFSRRKAVEPGVKDQF